MSRKKPAPDLIRGGHRSSEEDMRQRKNLAPHSLSLQDDVARNRTPARKDAARTLRGAGETLARGPHAGGARGGIRLGRGAGSPAQDARAAALALALRARRTELRCDEQCVEGAAREARSAFHAGAAGGGGRAGIGRWHTQMAAAPAFGARG